MYLCCRSISVKRVQWHHLRLVADEDSETGYNFTLSVAETKTDMELRVKKEVIMYANLMQAVFCPVLALCVLLYIFADDIEAAGDEAGSWPANAGEGLTFDEDEGEGEGEDGENKEDKGAPPDAKPKAFVFPNLSRGYKFFFGKMHEDGCVTFWSLFLAAAGIAGSLTGHSFRHMAHTFAFYVGVTSDHLRQFATWENRAVEAGERVTRHSAARERPRGAHNQLPLLPHMPRPAPPPAPAYDHVTNEQLDVIARQMNNRAPRAPKQPARKVPYAFTATMPFNIPLSPSFERFYKYAILHLAMAFGQAPPEGAGVTRADKMHYVATSMTRLIARAVKAPSVLGALHVAAAVAATAAGAAAAGLGGGAPAVGALAGVGIGAVVGFGATIVCEYFALRVGPAGVYASVAAGGVSALFMQRALLVGQLAACLAGVAVAIVLPFLVAAVRTAFSSELTSHRPARARPRAPLPAVSGSKRKALEELRALARRIQAIPSGDDSDAGEDAGEGGSDESTASSDSESEGAAPADAAPTVVLALAPNVAPPPAPLVPTTRADALAMLALTHRLTLIHADAPSPAEMTSSLPPAMRAALAQSATAFASVLAAASAGVRDATGYVGAAAAAPVLGEPLIIPSKFYDEDKVGVGVGGAPRVAYVCVQLHAGAPYRRRTLTASTPPPPLLNPISLPSYAGQDRRAHVGGVPRAVARGRARERVRLLVPRRQDVVREGLAGPLGAAQGERARPDKPLDRVAHEGCRLVHGQRHRGARDRGPRAARGRRRGRHRVHGQVEERQAEGGARVRRQVQGGAEGGQRARRRRRRRRVEGARRTCARATARSARASGEVSAQKLNFS